MLTVRTIDTTEAFFSMRREWDGLLERIPTAGIFLTFDWQSTWWRHYGQGAEPCLLAVYEGRELIGLAPLMKRVRRLVGLPAFHQLSFIGTGVSDRLDILLSPGKERQILEAMVPALQAQRWDVMDLQDVPEESDVPRQLSELMRPGNERMEIGVQNICPVSILPDDPEAFFAVLGEKFRRNIVYYDRRLRKGHAVIVDFLYEREGIAENMGDFLGVYRKSLANKPGTEAVVTDRFAEFRRELAERLASQGRAMLALMRLDGRLAAAQLCFMYRGICYGYNMCYDPDWRRLNVGTVLLGEVIRHSIERGCQAYDFLRGDEEYKRRWATKPRQNVRLRICKTTPKMRLLETGALLVRALKKRNIG